MKLILLPFVN